ncbi:MULTISPECIES: hypothetical protein [Streptomyces]|uniref:hypothetical protein n=1 Tax=Streptomyces TaxID=1883 RepID=UPI000699FCAF|nr:MULTISPECIES: hypothetical protein [Streptomyces]MYU57415.1 hypothetical protein [Streptomyces sp. SID7805]
MSVLALIGITPPAAITTACVDAHGAPASVSIKQPDAPIKQAAADADPLDYRSRPRLRTHAAVLVPIVRRHPSACDDEPVALAVKHLTEALYGQTDMGLVAMAEAVEVLLDVVDPRGSPGRP